MDSRCESSPRVPAHIVEDHDDVLPIVYRAIGSKNLPYHSITLVHFDAHPDLLSPNIKTDHLTDSHRLFAATDIADWILPAVYMGHVTCVVWLKPPWAHQIPDGEYSLIVGSDPATRLIRVATPLSYFISELLYVPKGQLENVREIPLLVVTVTDNSSKLEEKKDETLPPPAKLPRLEFEGIHKKVGVAKAWVMDVDLDFFSTGNPYRGPFSQDQYQLLTELYRTPAVRDVSCEQSVLEAVSERRKQLDVLQTLWSCDQSISQTLDNLRSHDLPTIHLTEEQLDLAEGVRLCLGTMDGDVLVDQEYVHTCGQLTELPLHVSCEGEVGGLVGSVTHLLEGVVTSGGLPALITIARSSVDEYTPSSQVDSIQQLLLTALTNVCGELDTHYQEDSPHREDSPSLHPAQICDCSYL